MFQDKSLFVSVKFLYREMGVWVRAGDKLEEGPVFEIIPALLRTKPCGPEQLANLP